MWEIFGQRWKYSDNFWASNCPNISNPPVLDLLWILKHLSLGTEDKEKFYCEEVSASVADIEKKMGQLHADLINAEMDRPSSIPPDEPYVDLGIIGM